LQFRSGRHSSFKEMNSIKCPNCNLTNWAHESACKRCGFNFAGSASPGTGPWQPNANYGGPQIALRSGLAVASMVLGIIAIPTSLFLIGLLLAPVALVLGIVALVKASKKPMVYGGKGFAIAGVATGAMALFLFVPLIAAIAIPNLLAARRAANEGSAISSLRTIHAAQQIYMSSGRGDFCGELPTLIASKLVDAKLSDGTQNGYRFEIEDGRIGCDIHATPISTSDGSRSFMVSNEGVFYAAKKHGLRADESDPELGH
jgi:hypothetical protein